jgi:hypothetical protein
MTEQTAEKMVVFCVSARRSLVEDLQRLRSIRCLRHQGHEYDYRNWN